MSEIFYLLGTNSKYWRKAFLLLKNLGIELLLPEVELEVRDLLPQYGLPRECWIDFKVIERNIKNNHPLPLVVAFSYLKKLQHEKGYWAVNINTNIPNSGATYRALEAGLLFFNDTCKAWMQKTVKYLKEQIKIFQGLPSPGPLEEAPIEVGTTARALHVLVEFESKKNSPDEEVLLLLVKVLKSYLYEDEKFACWHTDVEGSKLSSPQQGIVGATSLAFFALLKAEKFLRKEVISQELATKIARWLITFQKSDGGWGDHPGEKGKSNPDNTFNVVRSLTTFIQIFNSNLSHDLKEEIKKTLKNAKIFLVRCFEKKLQSQITISDKAMLARGLLLFYSPWDKYVIEVINELCKNSSFWYSPNAHLYNEFLIVLITLLEWLKKAHNSSDFYSYVKKYKNLALTKFLFEFPAEIYPFLPGYKDTVGERILNKFVRLRVKKIHYITSVLFESFNSQDIISLLVATFLFYTLFISEDFVKSFLCPNFLWFEISLYLMYFSWLILKFKTSRSKVNFLLTTISSFILAFGILKIVEASYPTLIKMHTKDLHKLFIVFTLIIDAGRRIIDFSEIDKFILGKK